MRPAPLTGAAQDGTGLPDVAWLRPDGREMGGADWEVREAASLVMLLYAPAREGRAADRVALAFHRGEKPVEMVLPPARPGFAWRLLADSAAPERAECEVGAGLAIAARSVAVLAEARVEEAAEAGSGFT